MKYLNRGERILFVISALIAVTCATIILHWKAEAVSPGETWQPPARAHWMKVPCPVEDGTDCAWNADVQGNGHGHSFYAVTRRLEDVHGHKVGRAICVYYVTKADRQRWDACHILPKH